MIREFKDQAAQGDMLLRRIQGLPAGVTAVTPEHGKLILAHSETGHHHAVEAALGIRFFRSENPLVSFLEVGDGLTADIIHHRPHDTHETVRVGPGYYEVRRQRESSDGLEAWKMVED